MNDAITLDKKHLYALRRSIIYINVCKKCLFKGIRYIYLLTHFFQEFLMEQATIRWKTTIPCKISSQFANRIQNYGIMKLLLLTKDRALL